MSPRLRVLFLLLGMSMLGACRSVPEPVAAPAGSEVRAYPASFVGTLPCADCEGIRTELNLFDDGVYFLRETYLGKPERENVFDDVGRWSVSADGGQWQLRGGRESPLRFQRSDDGALLLLDSEGNPVPSAFNYRLARDSEFRTLEPRIPLRGLVTRRDGETRFKECLTGRDLPLAPEADYASLANAYATVENASGRSVLATVEGRIVRRAIGVGSGTQEAVVVDRFRKLWPGETCGPRYVDAAFEGTRWKLAELAGEAVVPETAPQVAAITFDAGGGMLGGSTGCNRVNATYKLIDGVLTIGPAMITRMACPASAMAQESAFVAVLGKTVRAVVDGQQMRFFDAEGGVLARFEAIPAD
ncbi:META domain-containing protein [Arenimonas oryziterrae]|nr:META domain-containing protein [Arenimonas oryziterrae]